MSKEGDVEKRITFVIRRFKFLIRGGWSEGGYFDSDSGELSRRIY